MWQTHELPGCMGEDVLIETEMEMETIRIVCWLSGRANRIGTMPEVSD